MTKKIIALILAMIMLVSVTACTTDMQPQGGTSHSETNGTETSGLR